MKLVVICGVALCDQQSRTSWLEPGSRHQHVPGTSSRGLLYQFSQRRVVPGMTLPECPSQGERNAVIFILLFLHSNLIWALHALWWKSNKKVEVKPQDKGSVSAWQWAGRPSSVWWKKAVSYGHLRWKGMFFCFKMSYEETAKEERARRLWPLISHWLSVSQCWWCLGTWEAGAAPQWSPSCPWWQLWPQRRGSVLRECGVTQQC